MKEHLQLDTNQVGKVKVVVNTSEVSLAVMGNSHSDQSLWEHLPSQYVVQEFSSKPSADLSREIDIVLLKANRVDLSLIRQTEKTFPNAITAFYDLTENDRLVRYLLHPSVKGFFHRSDPADLFEKGLKSLSKGEYWLPREVMGKVLDSVKNQESNTTKAETALSDREMEVVHLVNSGEKNDDIALHLNISFHTVKTHLTHIYKKLDVKSRTELVSQLSRGEIRLN